MVRTKENYTKYFLTIVFVLVLLSSLGISANQAFAVGPLSCTNRYDGIITSAKIIVGNQTYYPMTNPGTTFEIYSNQTYTVTFVIHTPPVSSGSGSTSFGNSDPGSTWFEQGNAYESGDGTCVNGVVPNQDVTISANEFDPNPQPIEHEQSVYFSTLVPGFSYTVKWQATS